MDIDQKIREILEVLLEHKITSSDASQATEELWDSLKHFEILITIEEEFNIKFKEGDFLKLNSMKSIIEEVKNLLIQK